MNNSDRYYETLKQIIQDKVEWYKGQLSKEQIHEHILQITEGDMRTIVRAIINEKLGQ